MPRKCQATMKNFWKVSGQQLFCPFFGIQGNRLLRKYMVTSYCPCSHSQPTSCQPSAFSTAFLCSTGLETVASASSPFPSRALVCTLTLPPFLSFARPQRGCSYLQLALENFRSGGGRYLAHVVPPAGGSSAHLQVSSLQHWVGQRATCR